MADSIQHNRVVSAVLGALGAATAPMRVEDIQRATEGRFYASEVVDALAKGEREGLVKRIHALAGFGDAFVAVNAGRAA